MVGHLGCFCLLTALSRPAGNSQAEISVRTPVFSSFGCLPRGAIGGSYDNSGFNVLRLCQTVFPSDDPVSHSHE